jgi:Bifunctional DNA primase/polymerase, N-terminal
MSTSVANQAQIVRTSPDCNAQASNRSPFAETGARLIDNGYSAIPIAPGSKRPGQYDMKAWRNASQWQRYCDRLPTSIEMELWNDWPDAGVCVPLSQQLKAIDIDTDNPDLIAAVLAVLPDSEVKKRGKKGSPHSIGVARPLPQSRSASAMIEFLIYWLTAVRQLCHPPSTPTLASHIIGLVRRLLKLSR